MPRFFFHVLDGVSVLDEEGTELPDLYAAQAEAIRLSGEVLRDVGARFWNGSAWALKVADAEGRVLFVLRFSAEEVLAPPPAGADLPGFEPGPAEG